MLAIYAYQKGHTVNLIIMRGWLITVIARQVKFQVNSIALQDICQYYDHMSAEWIKSDMNLSGFSISNNRVLILLELF